MLRQHLNDNPPRPRCGQSRDRDRARAFGAVWFSDRPITAADVAELKAALEATDAKYAFGLHDQDEARDHLQAGLQYPTQRDLAVVQASLPSGYVVVKITGRLAWPKHVDYLTHEGMYELVSNFDYKALIAKYAPKKPNVGLQEIDRQLFEGELDPLHCAELYPDTYRKHAGKLKRTYDEGVRLRALRWEEQEERRLAAFQVEQAEQAKREREAEREAERERAEAAARRLVAEQAAELAWENSPVHRSEVAEEDEREAASRARHAGWKRQRTEEWLAAEEAWYATEAGQLYAIRYIVACYFDLLRDNELPVPSTKVRLHHVLVDVAMAFRIEELEDAHFASHELSEDEQDAWTAEMVAEIYRNPASVLTDWIAGEVPTAEELHQLYAHVGGPDEEDIKDFTGWLTGFGTRHMLHDRDAEDGEEPMKRACALRELGMRNRDLLTEPVGLPSVAYAKSVRERLINASTPTHMRSK